MSYVRSVDVTVTTNVGGVGLFYTDILNGTVVQVQYVKTDFDVGVDFTIRTATTQRDIWVQENVDASVTIAPGVLVSNSANGSAATDAWAPVVVRDEKIQVYVASAGASHTGLFRFFLE